MNSFAAQDVAEVLKSGYIGEGPEVRRFEQELYFKLELPSVPVATNSCTSALDLALELIGVGAGDEVVTTPMTCTATNGVIVKRGAIPVWADIDSFTGLIDPDDVANKITPKTKAIMAVDWGGAPAKYSALKKFGIPVIQDAAHSFGGDVGGDYVAYSFQAIKHLTTGDGGALLVPADQYERAKKLRWFGLDRESSASFRCAQDITEVGFKYHMNDIAAAIGRANLDQATRRLLDNRHNAYVLCQELGIRFVYRSSYWFLTLLVEQRDLFMKIMEDDGVETSRVHARNDKHTAFHFPNGPLPGVDWFADHMVAIPCGWWLKPRELAHIGRAVKRTGIHIYMSGGST